MHKQIYQFLLVLLIVFAGSIIWGNDAAYAGGSFDVPKVNDEFNQFDQAPPSQQEQPVNTPPVTEEKGFWDSVTGPFSEAWDWTTDKISDAVDWTTEKASAFWNWLTGVLSKITEVIVDALAATWDWTQKFKEYIFFAGVLILGIVLCVFATPLGVAVLTGMALSLVIGAGLNGWKFDKTVFLEAAIGGLLGLIGGGITSGASRAMASSLGKKLVTSAANSKVLGPLARGGGKLISKLPKPMQQVFGKAGLIGSVEGAGTSVADDLLHGRKINWKKALLSGVAGAALVGAGAFIVPKVEPMINKVTTAFQKAPVVKAAKRVDDCLPFAYQQQPGSYTAMAMSPFAEFAKCISAPDTGGRGGTSAPTATKIDDTEITKRKEIVAKTNLNPRQLTHPDLNEKAGKVGVDDNGIPYFFNYKGEKKKPVNAKWAGKLYKKPNGEYPTLKNGTEVKLTFDYTGFPKFDDWTSYETFLPTNKWKIGDEPQFKYLNNELFQKMDTDKELNNKIMEGMINTIKEGSGYKYGNIKFKSFLEKSKLNNGIVLEDVVKKYLSTQELSDLKDGLPSQKLYNLILDETSGNELRKAFIEANTNRIKNGDDPIGFTWHHHQEFGRMQLVKTNIHELVNHTGGRKTWGFGLR